MSEWPAHGTGIWQHHYMTTEMKFTKSKAMDYESMTYRDSFKYKNFKTIKG